MLHAEGLSGIFDDRVLFQALTLTVGPGELLQVAGDNGAGKTSLLRMLCGLTRPESGTVSWQGEPLASVREAFHRQLLILDEPFTALDASAIATLSRRLEQHVLAGGSAILTTHQPLRPLACALRTLRLGAGEEENA